MMRATFGPAWGALRLSLTLLLLLTLAACSRDDGAASGAASTAAKEGSLRIAVIPKGTTHEFWKSIHAGAVKASRELGVEIVWKGPLKEDDLKSQIDLVQSFTAQGVSGIVLAPLNDKGLVSAVKGAARSRVPVVIMDSALQGDHHTSFVATDNLAAGRLAGEGLAKLLEGKGGVLLLRYQEGSASTSKREQGFLEAIKKHEGIELLSDNRYGGATTESAFKAAENLLLAHKAAEGAVGGVFCPNESTTFGMLLALQKTGLAGKIRFIGFDSSEKLVRGLKDKQLDGLVLQNPFEMGYLGVKTMVAHLRGDKVEPVVHTASHLITSGNMDEPKMKELLSPDLNKWLGQ
jgi:ribose transport system substrate-binding protein